MKDLLKSILGIGIFILVLVAGLGLLRKVSSQPSVILSDTSCQPPCWNNIQPGVSSSDQVYFILSQMESIGSTMENTTMGGDLRSISWLFTRPIPDIEGTIYFQDEQVSLISILTINSLNLGDILARFEPPTQYWTAIGSGENRAYLTVGLLNPSQGYQVELLIDLEGKTNRVEIKDSSPVYKVKYFDPADLTVLLTKNTLIPSSAAQDAPQLPLWAGPGTLEFPR